MQVVMNKCFLLNPKKIWRRSVRKKGTLYFQKMTSPSRRLDSGAGTILGQEGKTESAKVGNAK